MFHAYLEIIRKLILLESQQFCVNGHKSVTDDHAHFVGSDSMVL